ncbi:MAG: outer membrane protein transport protein [Campylobacterales bacterium]|nr:outer membrane protein transport protein [Campylobacterales bacterium]
MLKTAAMTVLSSSVLFASGWRIPEQSSHSVALAGAYVANSNGADASYFNPANMVFNDDKLQAELSAMYIHLSSIEYTDAITVAKNSSSKKENKLIPTMFLSSKDYDGIRYGFSITAPGGLSKRWDSPYAKTFAQEFTLRIVEFNPTIAYKVSDNFSVAGGLRAIYSDGVVKSDGTVPIAPSTYAQIKREMEGDTIEFGYNLALSYKPDNKSNLALTYRSNIDLKEEGDAKLYYNGALSYNGGTSVSVPLPAVASLAYSYDFEKTTLELEYDRTYWSKYKELDFEYDNAIPNPILISVFDNPKSKNWKDTDAFRIGITHKYNDKLTLMAGFAIDENPTPDATIGFELPDSDAKLYSFGFDYKLDNDSSIGFGYLYDKKESRSAVDDSGAINGTFDGASAHLVSVGYRTAF